MIRILALLILSTICLPASAVELSKEARERIRFQLVKIAGSINKDAPFRVDRAIVLKNATAEGLELKFNYLLDKKELRLVSQELYGTEVTDEEIAQGLKASTLATDCSDEKDMLFLFGVQYGRYYYDERGKLLFWSKNAHEECVK